LGLFAAIGVIVWWGREGWLRVFGVSVCGLALVASDARTTWFACAVAVIVLVAGKWYKARSFSPGRFVLGASLLGLAASLIFIFVGARDELGHITFNGRTAVWQFVGDRWDESAILGHGPGVWSSLISHEQVPDWWGQAHNQFLQSLYTTGLIGVGLLLLLVWYWTMANLRFARDGSLLPLALEALLVINGLFESPLSLGGVTGDVWLLSILLFLRPAGSQLAPMSATPVDQAMRHSPGPLSKGVGWKARV
jgi:O-antigen ligase